jgi:hypothetical protein
MKEKLKADGVEVDFERHDDYILQSFLRARALDVDKAYELFVQSLVRSPVLRLFIYSFIIYLLCHFVYRMQNGPNFCLYRI